MNARPTSKLLEMFAGLAAKKKLRGELVITVTRIIPPNGWGKPQAELKVSARRINSDEDWVEVEPMIIDEGGSLTVNGTESFFTFTFSTP